MNEKSTICAHVQHGTDEWEELVALRDEVLRQPLGMAYTPEELAGEKDSFHLACRCADKMVACVILKPLAGKQIRLRQMAVRAGFQGKGMGRTLVEFAESFARNHGYEEILLHARETAVGFYARLGYEVEGERFTEVTLPHFLMRKNLTDKSEQAPGRSA